jgi:hypothetical protein
MKLAEFKRQIRGQVGARYSLTARYLATGAVKFTLPARTLTTVNTVGLAFKSNPEDNESFIYYPKSAHFEGDANSFSFVDQGFGVRMDYILA